MWGWKNIGEFATCDLPTKMTAIECDSTFFNLTSSEFFFRLTYATENMGRRFWRLGLVWKTSSCGVVSFVFILMGI